MTVRPTEARLPSGFRAADLGEAAVVLGPIGTEDYALVSYLSEPLAAGFAADYVVFVTNGDDVTSYDWTAELIGTGLVDNETTDVGVFSYVPPAPGLLQLGVGLNLASGQKVSLFLLQEVRPAFTGFEFFFEAGGLGAQLDPDYSVAALGSDPDASAELANSFRNDILSASADHALPARLVAAVAYLGCMRAPKHDEVGITVWTPGRDQKLAWAASELNGEFSLRSDLDDPLGVCQLSLPTLAMIVGPQRTSPATYTTWRERAVDGSDAGDVADAIWTDFDALPDASKVDLFNLARFPRTNIELCATLLSVLRDRPNRWPGLTADQLIADPFAPVTLASELDAGADAGARPTAQQADGETTFTGAGGSVAGFIHLPLVLVLFPDSLQDGAGNYGGRDLERGDNGPDVAQLQDDLRELGFAIIIDPVGVFDRTTEWAVRELQIYAKVRFLAVQTNAAAQRYLAGLERALNLYHYAGPISGVVNVGTRIVIHHWKTKNWRCPVIVEAWDTNLATINDSSTVPSRTLPAAGFGNIWRHDQPPEPASEAEADERLMFVRDFTQIYDVPANRIQDLSDPDDLFDVGCHFPYTASGGPLTSPGGVYYGRSRYPSVWAEAEILPDNLVGVPLADLTPAQLATFRVVRAVSEMECLGFFDSVNCYDTAFVSMGPAHWTLGLSGPIREGELCGYLSYLAAFDAQAFHAAFERFGLRIDERWVDDTGDRSGRSLFNADERKYTGWVALQGEDGQYSRQYFTVDDANYFRNWHWVYRVVMAGRAIAGFQTGMWDMARIRLRDIMTTPFPAAFAAAENIPDVPDGAGGTRTATIGDVFTSEEAAGVLLRWHIYQPFDICNGGEAGPRVQGAVDAVGLPGAGADRETDLVDALEDQIDNVANADIRANLNLVIPKVRNWPVYGGRPAGYALPNLDPLDDHIGSFGFDDSGLPPAPT